MQKLLELQLKLFENVNSQLVTFTQRKDKQLSVSLAADMDNEALDGNISASPATPENRSDLPGPPHSPTSLWKPPFLFFWHSATHVFLFISQTRQATVPTALMFVRHSFNIIATKHTLGLCILHCSDSASLGITCYWHSYFLVMGVNVGERDYTRGSLRYRHDKRNHDDLLSFFRTVEAPQIDDNDAKTTYTHPSRDQTFAVLLLKNLSSSSKNDFICCSRQKRYPVCSTAR